MSQAVPAHDADAHADALWRNEHQSDAAVPHLTEKEAAQRNKEVVKRLNHALNEQQFEVFAQVFSPDFVNHDGSAVQVGSAALIGYYQSLIDAVPDFHSESEEIIAQYDRVAVRLIYKGTHLGNFRGMAPPSGNTLQWTGSSIYRFGENGMILECWQDVDNLSLFMQLGIIKLP